jgi:hypothetical protein
VIMWRLADDEMLSKTCMTDNETQLVDQPSPMHTGGRTQQCARMRTAPPCKPPHLSAFATASDTTETCAGSVM